MRRVLLIDSCDEHATMLRQALHQRGFDVRTEDHRWRTLQALRQPVPEWEFVIIVARNRPEEQIASLRELVIASQQYHQSDLPVFLFASCVGYSPSLRIQIEKLGVRYVRL